MELAFIAFLAFFILVGSAGLLMFYRAETVQRLSAALAPDTKSLGFLGRLKTADPKASLKSLVQPLEKFVPKSAEEVSVIQKRLIRAGLRRESYVRIFYGAKALTPAFLCLLVFITHLTNYFGWFAYLLALGFGWLIPDFWLGRKISRRQTNIRLGLPDFLDLMVVCMEAGLSIDQATQRTAGELRLSHPEITDELGLMLLEQRAGRPRGDAWKHLAERTDVLVIRTLVSAVVQADHFGTSLAKILRVHAETLRTQRRQAIEEEAAKTTVKLVFPLVLFIMPSLFVVTLGPALISLQDVFENLMK